MLFGCCGGNSILQIARQVGRAFQNLGAAIDERSPADFLDLGTCRVVRFEKSEDCMVLREYQEDQTKSCELK